MPKFLEAKLKHQYGAKSKAPYKIMNAIGAMRGNQETEKGKMMQKKHDEISKFKGESHGYSFKRPLRKIVSRYKK